MLVQGYRAQGFAQQTAEQILYTGAALVHPASPEMNALPRWLLLALFALLIAFLILFS